MCLFTFIFSHFPLFHEKNANYCLFSFINAFANFLSYKEIESDPHYNIYLPFNLDYMSHDLSLIILHEKSTIFLLIYLFLFFSRWFTNLHGQGVQATSTYFLRLISRITPLGHHRPNPKGFG